MPRATKTKAGVGKASAPPEKKKRAAPKKNKLYQMPEHIPEGTILSDVRQKRWQIGSSIGTGGFGEIYLACRADAPNKFDYVVKCEPFENGPLFVEMNFYQRHLKLENIEAFKGKHKLKSLGLPYLFGTGSEDLNGKRHRFIVMPRYGNDIQKYLDENGGKLPEGTVYRLAIQMLDVFDFMHSVGYIHSDLKAQNILLGYGKGGASQAYLVDFGLAAHEKIGNYKADPKKMHNGTINYTSRDAHNGITSKRTDLEILGYNLIEWLGGILPWVKDKLLENPAKVQLEKEKFMQNVGKNLMTIFPNCLPGTLKSYMEYIAKIDCGDVPDYEKCRKIFHDGLKSLKIPNTGDLDFKLKNVDKSGKSKSRTAQQASEIDSSEEVIEDSDSDDDFTIEKTKVINKRKLPPKVIKTPIKKSKMPIMPVADIRHELYCAPRSPKKLSPRRKTPVKRSAPQEKNARTENGKSSESITPSPRQRRNRTPLTAKTYININPAITVGRSSPKKTQTPTKLGKTTLNSNLTPPMPTRTGNKYEFNIELDVSMDADVKVNVKRKKRPETYSTDNTKPKTAADKIIQSSEKIEDRSKVRKLDDEPNVRTAHVRSKRK